MSDLGLKGGPRVLVELLACPVREGGEKSLSLDVRVTFAHEAQIA